MLSQRRRNSGSKRNRQKERKKVDRHDQNNTLLNPTGTLLSTLRGQISAQLERSGALPPHPIDMWLLDEQLEPSTVHF